MPDYNQPPDVTKRPRYFDNQFLLEQDFIDEQKYHIDRQRRHDRLLHTSGVAEGLEVTKVGRMQVSVAPGTAVDSLGRHILLASPRVADLTGDGTKRLYLRFRETETDVAEGEGVSGATRFTQNPELVFPLEGTAVGVDQVLLAEVTVAGGEIQTVTMNARPYAGVHLPGPGGGQTLRSSADGQRAELAGSLSVSQSLQVLGGAIVPKVGAHTTDGIMFPPDPAGGTGDGAFIRYYGLGGEGTILQIGIDNDSDDVLSLWQMGKDRLVIRDGNVSVAGKLTVQEALSVTGDLSVSKNLKVTGGAIAPKGGYTANDGIMFPPNPADGAGDGAFIRYYGLSGEGTILQIGIDNDSDDVLSLWQMGKDRLVIRDGNVTVNGKLQVPEGPIVPRWGAGDNDGILFPPNPGGGEADVAFMRYSVEGKTENTTLRIGIDNDAEDTLRLWQMGKDRLVIRNGNIGIGTTAPDVLLHLEQPRSGSGIRINSYTGKRHFEMHFDQNDNFCFYYQHRQLTGGLSGAGEWMGQTGGWNRFTASDASLKENVAELQGVLEKVLRLRPVSFDWKNTGTRDMGLIAQEVEQVFPQLVSETRSNETSHKGVAYSAFGLLAIAALQELKRQYDERLSVLESRHTHGAA
jgi:hypothetical protein